mmetsp:Transcript_38309/g.46255  ORF Transcript_38309/g.46255 Transcript_38309/m.46255 type:complete len:148 (-) Transcript_38309:206-649(-)
MFSFCMSLNVLSLLTFLVMVVCYEASFLSHRQQQYATFQHPESCYSISGLQTQLPQTAPTFCFRSPNRSAVILHDAKNNRDDEDVKLGNSSMAVEDGSPLGIAIVVLGGSFVVFGDETFNVPLWVIFATASTAVGIARLIRYLQDTE